MSEREKPIPVSVTLPQSMIDQITARTAQIDLTRSQYFRALVRKDIEESRRMVQPDLQPAEKEQVPA